MQFHICNQYVFVGDAQKEIKRLEAKKLRLGSLAGYSRENAVARDAVNDYLSEAVAMSRIPVKAHFNVLAWSRDIAGRREIRNKVASAMSRLDAVAKLESDGAAQIWFAGLPGNAADFPMNDRMYWMDFGNSRDSGQVLLSTLGEIKQPESKKFTTVAELPTIMTEYNGMLGGEKDDDLPSCSLAQALGRQDLFINSALADLGASLLWMMFSVGMLRYRGFFLNLAEFRTTGIKI